MYFGEIIRMLYSESLNFFILMNNTFVISTILKLSENIYFTGVCMKCGTNKLWSFGVY